ncbi:hypothetical protein KSB_48800 [Ktedonobacter robiniae]|uniref:Uncharacterized protein n=1 Tax=Ktedonobacter robiniae TaxID=2778365 RepID=A0ABQ3UVG6_9CHLR|nr:hypothetical protein KSB_48800 [Ktedonobacter robiniae]
MREQGPTNKQVDHSSRARIAEEPGRLSAACSRGETVEDPSQTLPSPKQEEGSLVAIPDESEIVRRAIDAYLAWNDPTYQPTPPTPKQGRAIHPLDKSQGLSVKVM